MTRFVAVSREKGTAVAIFVGALAALTAGVNGYSIPLASDPTNVRSQWDLPGVFGRVSIPGFSVTSPSNNGYYDDGNDDNDFFLSPLQPVDPYSQDFSEEHGHSGYEPSWNPRSRSRSLLPLPSSSPSPLSTGSIWSSNNIGGKYTNSFRKDSNRRIGRNPFTRATPALSMANYMQNNGNGNRRNNSYNNRDYDGNNYNRDNYDYDDRDRDRNNRNRVPYNNDRDRYGSPRGGQPRGTNRFNTVGSIGSVNGSNASREGRSMQFQNRQDSNTVGRSGRMMDDSSFRSFSPDSNSRFESRRPNDNYAKGGYRQDARTGHWTDPNSNYNINDSPRSTYSSDNRYTSPPSSSSSSSSSFTAVPPGDYANTPEIRGASGYDRGFGGSRGNVPYDNDNYHNYDNRDNYDHNRDPNNSDNDFYSVNGNIMDNRRGSRGRQRGTGAPGMGQNYFNVDHDSSNRRMDRGGGMMRYRPNNQRGDGGYYGNGYEYEVGGYDGYDEYYDSSGSFYNSEGKRVRRFDPYSDGPEGYYNPDHLSNDSTDPDRMIQNQRRRDGRDVQNGAHLRRYDPQWDGRQGLYDEASLYGSDVKSTRSYTNGYSDSMDHRVVGRNRRGDSEHPTVLGGSWVETGGQNRYPMTSTSRSGDYQDGEYIEDRYDRERSQFNRPRDRDRRDGYDYEGDDGYGRDRRSSARRGLGRRDMESDRDYYRSENYRGPDIRGDDSMERFRQGKDVKKNDLYGFETANTPSSKKRIQRRKNGRSVGAKRPQRGDDMREGRTANGSYNAPSSRGRRGGGGRINGSGGRDRGLSLDDLNEMM
eukprot:CAMPEP_0197194094 /NCGR_PEP_ID=MMETSP1423-20130617/28644_1 /TAXON_ID=476441 /ORGANISM="Pseudo-nitzschia heimii, Strain UNC1101" /LENGTH=808 /DNA_ID=CAMNT_0042647461 /DNA_START=312 /DNA_END=2738 /DNA_ORIENTATION=+